MPSAPTFLIYATATLAPNPATQLSWIEYPSALFCNAKAAEFRAALAKPESIKDRADKQVTIKIEPRCTAEPPQIWIAN